MATTTTQALPGANAPGATAAVTMSTIAFTACFAVWTIFAIIGVKIKQNLHLTGTEFGLLAGTPILTGSIIRLHLGVWTDQYGGRIVMLLVMLAGAAATFLLSYAHTYPQYLLAALGVGIAGGSFAVGIAYVAKFFPKEKQGAALGIFGAGNVGAAVTKFAAPFVMVTLGWTAVAQIWAGVLALTALIFYLTTRDDPQLLDRRRTGVKPESLLQHLEPLKNLQVWRFSLYYFFVFGGFVALALWLPNYMVGGYKLGIVAAGMMAAAYSIPGSLFRVIGGYLSDKIGARKVMYGTFWISVICTFVLSYPPTTYVIDGMNGPISFRLAMGVVPFTVLLFVLGFAMAAGKAAVYKHIPIYYPDRIGSVGGLVGLIGGLGGFVLPIAFGALNDAFQVRTSCFMLLFVVAVASLAWMHFSIRKMEQERVPQLRELPELPEMSGMHPANASSSTLRAAPRAAE